MKIDVTSLDGEAAGSIDLDDTIFGLDPRVDLIARMVRYQLAKRRAGTHQSQGRADVSRDGGPVLGVKTVSRGACFADYDNDGKVDAFVVNLGAPATLLHNISQNNNHWLTVKLKGKKSNRDGIGAHLELVAGGRKQIAERFAGSGYLSQDDGRIHFGIGTATKADKLTIHWPSGQDQVLENLAIDQVLTVEER